MPGSDQDLGKKMVEENDLLYFLESYEAATGETFPVMVKSETPDFIGRDHNGQAVGIELTQLKFHPGYMFWQRAIEKRDWADDDDVFWRIISLIGTKAQKLSKGRWPECERRILVIQLVDYPLSELIDVTETDIPDGEGFTEIWFADYSIFDIYGGVDLFPVAHPNLSGPFLVASTDKKPWG